jgi:phage tail sheath protein FI
MTTTSTIPGVRFTAVPRPAELSPLRSDVAGFLGRTRRGPVGVPVRVEGFREYLRDLGGLDRDAVTPYAIRSYFENGGEVAWVIRLGGDAGRPASKVWEVGPQRGFCNTRYQVEASSPGAWANGTTVAIRVQRVGRDDRPVVDLEIQAPGEPPELLAGLDPRRFEEPGGVPSALVRLVPVGERQKCDALPGPRLREERLELAGGSLLPPDRIAYGAAAERLGDQSEVALVAVPDIATDLPEADRRDLFTALILRAEELHDRLVLIDLPCGRLEAKVVIEELNRLPQDAPLRAAAVYHPWVAVPDPLGGIATPLRSIPPSGPVAGLISRLDRERGSHHTPANAGLTDGVDLSRQFTPAEQELLFAGRVNLLRCAPGRGLQVWGGRTLDTDPSGRFVAHRRLVHRLVRAIRAVAEPLVFEINGPELWLAFFRAVTSLLLAAWRRGGLKGTRPEEAFRVQCDEETNPPAARDLGRVLCRIELAPAVPMEFIELRVALSADGRLEVSTP